MSTNGKQVGAGGVPRRSFLALGGAAVATLTAPLRLRAAPERVDVVIVGAGLAGLNAAMLLEELGASVLVLEARGRPGGRCYTRDAWPRHVDVGASQIGGSYARVIDRCRQLGIELAPGSHMNAPYAPVIGGQLVSADDWADSKYNLTQGDERALMPHTLVGHYIGKRTPFDELTDWSSPEAAQYDISIAEWLRREGASAEVMRMIYEATGRVSLDEQSVLRMLQEATRAAVEQKRLSADKYKQLDQYEIASLISSHIVGGTSRLPEAMAETLGDRVRLNTAVGSIEEGPQHCSVRLTDGGTVEAGHVLMATPFSSLRNIDFQPGLSGAQAEAVGGMVYNNQSQVWFEIKAPYWEEDGYGASMWSDGPLQYIRQQIEPDGSREVMSAIASGTKAKYLDSLSPQERGEFARREIERIRPSTKGKLEVFGVHSWNEGTAAGGCSYLLPTGRVLDWVNNMAKPHGRVHFAGEHLRQLEVGMEAAMESGERAALEIISRSMG